MKIKSFVFIRKQILKYERKITRYKWYVNIILSEICLTIKVFNTYFMHNIKLQCNYRMQSVEIQDKQ